MCSLPTTALAVWTTCPDHVKTLCIATTGAGGGQSDGLPPRRGHGSMGLLSYEHRQFGSGGNLSGSGRHAGGSPYMSKLESIASSAVRAADKVMASLIIVYTHSGAHLLR